MGSRPEHTIDGMSMHFITACLFLTLFILTWVGVGDIVIVSMLGLLLCVAGLAQGDTQTDLWVLVPLLFYNLFSMASSYVTYGNLADGYASIQMIYPVIYLLLSYLDEKQRRSLRCLCVLWAATVAAAGLLEFAWDAAVRGGAGRLGGFLGNPNAMGIFLVIGWFLLYACREKPEQDRLSRSLVYAEPVLLAALALTLSMGSFVAMAAGIAVLFYEKKRQTSLAGALRHAAGLLAKVVLGVGVGLLLYLTGTRTDVPWVCVPLLLYLLAWSVCWKKWELFLEDRARIAAGITAAGVLMTALIILIRPSSYATFAERLEMMRSAFQYLTVNPLLGVGPYRWRYLDRYDGGTYYNTWHIHNVLLHAGVELGLPAMAMLAAVAVRALCRKGHAAGKAGFAAFLVHNMMDTSFFYTGITTLVLLAAGGHSRGKKAVCAGVVRGLFVGAALFFAGNLYFYMTA